MFLAKLAPLQKRPPRGQTWQISDDPAVHGEWKRQGFNVGLMCRENSLIIIDADTKETARSIYRTLRKEDKKLVSVVTESRRGAHFLFEGIAEKSYKLPDIDVKASGYVFYPNSVVVTEGVPWEYKFIHDRFEDIQPFPSELFPKPEAKEPQSRIECVDMVDRVEQARRRLLKITPPKEGERNAKFFYVACLMVQQWDLDPMTCWPLLLEFNARANPPWDMTNDRERQELFNKLLAAERLK